MDIKVLGTGCANCKNTVALIEQVAKDIVAGIAAGKPVVYTPGIWRVIMLVVMHLPRVVFNKLNI